MPFWEIGELSLTIFHERNFSYLLGRIVQSRVCVPLSLNPEIQLKLVVEEQLEPTLTTKFSFGAVLCKVARAVLGAVFVSRKSHPMYRLQSKS